MTEQNNKRRVGSPQKWGEETKVIGVRVPISRIDEVREVVRKHLNKFVVKPKKK